MEIHINQYDGPTWNSNTPCTVCNQPLQNRLVEGEIVLCKHDFWQYTETGATLTDTTCPNCFWTLITFHDQIANYQATGDPDNYDWIEE
jgi:hypothetical protein